MTQKEREVYAEKALDLGNIAFGALVFGQFLGEHVFQWWSAALGAFILILAYIVSHFLLQFEEEAEGER